MKDDLKNNRRQPQKIEDNLQKNGRQKRKEDNLKQMEDNLNKYF